MKKSIKHFLLTTTLALGASASAPRPLAAASVGVFAGLSAAAAVASLVATKVARDRSASRPVYDARDGLRKAGTGLKEAAESVINAAKRGVNEVKEEVQAGKLAFQEMQNVHRGEHKMESFFNDFGPALSAILVLTTAVLGSWFYLGR